MWRLSSQTELTTKQYNSFFLFIEDISKILDLKSVFLLFSNTLLQKRFFYGYKKRFAKKLLWKRLIINVLIT